MEMRKGRWAIRLVVGFGMVAALAASGWVIRAEARDVTGVQDIQRGAWQETTPLKSYTTYRLLCVDGMSFLSMEGYGWGESSSTSSQLVQVLDKTGQPKTCQ